MTPEPHFFDKIARMTALVEQNSDSPTIVGDLRELLRDQDVRREFFNILKSPTWIRPLLDQGYFGNRPSTEREHGTGVSPTWAEWRYLTNMAAKAPSEVAAIFARTEIEDPLLIGDMIKAALAMPVDVAGALVPNIARAAREQKLWIFRDACNLCVRLAKSGAIESALKLANALFAPTFESGHEGPSRRDTHSYKEGLKLVVPMLAELTPREFLPELCGWLKACVEARKEVSSDCDYSYIWRPAIEEHEQNKDYEFAGVMVGFVRDGFEEAIRAGTLTLEAVLQIIEQYPHLVFQRIGLHLINEFADHNADLASEAILDRELFDDYQYKHEYAMLVGRRFCLLSPEQRDVWFSWVDAGPDTSGFGHLMKNLGRDMPTEADRRDWIDDWKFGKLHWIRKELRGDRRAFYRRLLAKHGEPSLADLNVRVSAGFASEESPVTVDQLMVMPFEQAVHMVSSWRPEGSRWTDHSIEGLAATFERYVASNPADFSVKARSLIAKPAIFVRAFIGRMREAMNTGGKIDLPAVLDLCEWVVGRPVEERTTARQVHESLVDESWQWTREEISRFLEGICGAESEGSPLYPLSGLRERLWNVIGSMCHDRSESYIVRDISTDDAPFRDYLDHAINSPRGKALAAAFEYARWVANHLKQTKDHKEIIPGGFEAMREVREMLEWQIMPENRSIEAMALIGSQVPLIHWIDAKWLAENADRLFSLAAIEQPPPSLDGWAAWNAFLVWVGPHIEFYRLLKPQFIYSIEQAAKVVIAGDSREHPMVRLGEHLMVIYGRGQLGLDDDNGLLRRFLDNASPEIRRRAIEFIGHSLADDNDVPPEVIERFQTLWDVYWAGSGKNDSLEAPDAWSFGGWFSCGKFPNTWALDRLEQFVDVNPVVEPNHRTAERLGNLLDVDVAKSLRILDKVIRCDRERWRVEDWLESAKRIIERGLLGSEESKSLALALIDLLGRRGYMEFGQLLPR